MNEKKKILILLGGLIGIILFVVIGSICENNKSNKVLGEFYDAYKGTENKLVMIGRSDCSWCQLYQPTLDFMKEQYEFDYIYVDINKLSNSVFKKLLKDINVSEDEFGTPITLVVSNNSVVDSINGYVDESELLEFLKKYEFAPSDSKLTLNYVDYSGYKKILKSSEAKVLVIGQTSCSYCIKAKPILNRVSKDNNLKINFLNITEFTQEEREKFSSSLSYLSENEWGTPLTLIIKDGKVIDSANGLLDYDGYTELFRKNNLIK